MALTGTPIWQPPTSCLCCGGPLAGEWAICRSCQQRAQAMSDAMDRADDNVRSRAERTAGAEAGEPQRIDSSTWND